METLSGRLDPPPLTPDRLLEPAASAAYLADPWNRRYQLGLYFSAIMECGEPVTVPWCVEAQGRERQWFWALHALFDAYAILARVAPKTGITFTAPQPSPRQPAALAWLRAMRFAQRSRPVEPLRWRDPCSNDNSSHYRHERLSRAATDALHQRCRALGISLTAALSWQLARCSTQLLTENQVTRWMIPASVRGATSAQPTMQASYLGLNIHREQHVREVAADLRRRLKLQEHWGNWAMAQLGLRCGRQVILAGTRRSLARTGANWLGVLSNLGDIGGSDADRLAIFALVRRHRPVGVTTYLHGGRQNLAVQVHASQPRAAELVELITSEFGRLSDALRSRA